MYRQLVVFFLSLHSHLVTAYSLRPVLRLVAENVPIHPRKRFSLPNFHVTNSGLKNTS